MATGQGQVDPLQRTDVRPMGRTARGVIGIRLAKGRRVVEMEVLSGKPDILTVTENGYGKRTRSRSIGSAGRGGSGIINIRTTPNAQRQRRGLHGGRRGRPAADDHRRGKIIRMNVGGISRIGRATQGVGLIRRRRRGRRGLGHPHRRGRTKDQADTPRHPERRTAVILAEGYDPKQRRTAVRRGRSKPGGIHEVLHRHGQR